MTIDNRIKELIAVGASIAAHCQPCLQFHAARALENGAARQEIAEAIEIGKMVRKVAASKMDTFVSRLQQAAAPAANPSNGECGCCS